MAENGGSASRLATAVSVWKDIVVLIRDLFLVVLAVLLIFLPQMFNDILTRAGFEEGSFAGLKWKSGFAETRTKLEQVTQQLASQQQANADLQRQLAEAKKFVSDESLKTEIANTELRTQQVASTSAVVQTSVQQTLAETAQLASKLPSELQPVWAVVFGSDTTLDGAQFEVQKAASEGIPNARVFHYNGNYRSAVVAADRSQAAALLQLAKQHRASSYLTNLNSWCRSQTDKPGYVECS